MSQPSVPFPLLMKAVVIVSSPTLLVLSMFVIFGSLDLSHFLYAYGLILTASAIFLHPFLGNLNALTHYANDLAEDKKVTAPDLSFLSTVGELSEALSRLHRSWEKRRQEMENTLTEREILLDSLPDMLVMVDAAKRIVRTNKAARNLFGQNLAGQPLKEVIPSDTLMHGIDSMLDDLRGREVSFHLDEPQPRDFLAVIDRFPVPSSGGIAIIITLNDVTELRQLEKMRADFVANASHEIRTPLASLMGFVETLRGPARDDEVAREEFLKLMAEQGERMTRLVTDLLSLSKIEMNAHTIPVGRVDLADVVRMEAGQFNWQLKEKNMTLAVDIAENLPNVRGERGELTQVVHNLISNAIKYGSGETEVSVKVEITSQLPPDPQFLHVTQAIRCSVQDRGEGIAAEHIPRLTERFYRVDTARSRKAGGTGLGLAIVKHIIQRHRGSLVIESTVGVGSQFSFYLPIYLEQAEG